MLPGWVILSRGDWKQYWCSRQTPKEKALRPKFPEKGAHLLPLHKVSC